MKINDGLISNGKYNVARNTGYLGWMLQIYMITGLYSQRDIQTWLLYPLLIQPQWKAHKVSPYLNHTISMQLGSTAKLSSVTLETFLSLS